MFAAQLAAFLLTHHHAHWAHDLTQMNMRQFHRVLLWAVRHGFVYQP